jgi:hypothetical protein
MRYGVVLMAGLFVFGSLDPSSGGNSIVHLHRSKHDKKHGGHRHQDAVQHHNGRNRFWTDRLKEAPNYLKRPGLDRCGISAVVMCPPAPY